MEGTNKSTQINAVETGKTSQQSKKLALCRNQSLLPQKTQGQDVFIDKFYQLFMERIILLLNLKSQRLQKEGQQPDLCKFNP